MVTGPVVEGSTAEGNLVAEVGDEIAAEAAASGGALSEAVLCGEELKVVLCGEGLNADLVETVAMAVLDGHAVVEANRDRQSSTASCCSAGVRSMGVALSA